MRITPLMRRLIRRGERKARDEAALPGAGELNIVPFLDIVVNLMMFLLATATSVLAISQADAQLRTHGRIPGPHTLTLTVVLADEALLVTGSGIETQHFLRGPEGHYDFDAMQAALIEIKAQHPAEDQVIITADPEIPYEEVVRAMDSARASPAGPMFPDVLFAAGVR